MRHRSRPVGRVAVVGVATQSGGDSEIIADARRTDWTTAGVEGGITHRTSVYTTVSPYTGTAGTLNTAISNCSTAGGGVVALEAGTYSLSTTIVMKPNVTLRGVGMTSIISFTNMGGSNFYWGAAQTGLYFGPASYDASRDGFDPSWTGATVANTRTWTGCAGVADSFPQGATVLNLNSAPTGLAVGDMLQLWQLNDASASLPKAGYLCSSKQDHSGSTATGISWQESNQTGTSGQQQRVKVTAISGSDVTIWPGLYLPAGTWRTDRTPKVSWQTAQISSAGVEDCLIRSTSFTSGHYSLVQFWFAANCWITRCGLQPRYTSQGSGGAVDYVIDIFESRNCSMTNNWMDYAIGGGIYTFTTYGYHLAMANGCLIENNIADEVESPFLVSSGASGNVIAYNYEINGASQEGGQQNHEVGVTMNLTEGNQIKKVQGDGFHGPSMFVTYFRNYTFAEEAGFDAWSYHRYWNVIGNVIAATDRYKTLCTDGTLYDRWSGSAFRLGYNSQGATTNAYWNGSPNIGVAIDADVATTMMIWGNYTATDSTTRWNSSEVPSGETYYPNPVPSTETLPDSLFRTSIPDYFTVDGTTVAWPPIGPDVTGGTYVGGRVHKLPAQLMHELSSGVIANFDPSLYGV
jgi:hypothetical protein